MKNYEIKKGDKFECIKNYDKYGFSYIKGSEYLSEADWCISDKQNCYTDWKDNDEFFEYFEKITKPKCDEQKTVKTSELPTIPIHYQTDVDFDVIDFCNVYDLNFNRGSVVKYVVRAGKKDDEIKDLEKALDFIQREIKYLKEK